MKKQGSEQEKVKKPSLICNLDTYLDENDKVRVQRKLSKSDLSKEYKIPIVLLNDSSISKLRIA